MAYPAKRKASAAMRAALKRKKTTKSGKRKKRMKKRRSKRRDSETLSIRSVAQDFWISNPGNTDFVGAQLYPLIGPTSSVGLDGFVNLSNTLTGNGWTNTDCLVMSDQTRTKYASLYKYYKVNYIWLKYQPAITQGTAFTFDGSGAEVSGSAVTGQITFAVIRDVSDRDTMTNSAEGNKKLRARKNAKTVNMYKPCFIKYIPSEQVTYETGAIDKTRIEYKQSYPTDDFANFKSNTVAVSMEVPKQCGIQQLSTNPFDGTNFPAELNSVCIGNYVMGCSVTFFGKKGQE